MCWELTGAPGTHRCAGNPRARPRCPGAGPTARQHQHPRAVPTQRRYWGAGAAACAFPGTAGGGRTQQRSEQIPVYIAKICINMNIYLHVFLKGLLPEIYRWGSEVLVAGRYQLLQKKKSPYILLLLLFLFF